MWAVWRVGASPYHPDRMLPIHLVITTHTTRHLRRSLMGAAHQTRTPASIVVSCDNDLGEIREVVRAASAEFASGLPAGLVIVQRPALGVCALAQVRNNGVRALRALGAGPDDRVVFHDGDCCPAADDLSNHARLLTSADLVCAYRVDLTPEQTEAFDESAVAAGRPPGDITPEQRGALALRERRLRRQALLRRLLPMLFRGRSKAHKPKILGANFSCSLAAYDSINGFDEEYLGYGSEDDDFARRLYATGHRPAVGVGSCIVYHQWHPTRAPESWHRSRGVERFKMILPPVCERGLRNPIDQQPPMVWRFLAGECVECFSIGRDGSRQEPPMAVRA